jgi:hypothetical protein
LAPTAVEVLDGLPDGVAADEEVVRAARLVVCSDEEVVDTSSEVCGVVDGDVAGVYKAVSDMAGAAGVVGSGPKIVE